MGILRTNTLSGIGTDGPVFDGVTRLDTQGYVVPPVGVTSDRTLAGVTTAQGSIRFNTDSQKLEFFAQDQWFEMVIDTPDLAVGSNTGAGARGVFAAGGTPTNNNNTIDYINIGSTGNAVDFGDLSGTARRDLGALSSSSRAVFGGGMTDPAGVSNSIDFITVSSTGNAATFGTLSLSRRGLRGTSSSTRGLFIGGNDNGPNQFNTIDYITIASTGNAQDFGDLSSSAGKSVLSSLSSSTRALSAGGDNPSGVNVIEFITISTIGNAVDFGDISSAKSGLSGLSNATRGIFGGGFGPGAPAPAGSNVIDYVTIASTGNSIDFGDLTRTTFLFASCSSSTRGVFGGGYGPQPTQVSTIDYVTIATQGNAVSFGNLTASRAQISGCSNGHGGL